MRIVPRIAIDFGSMYIRAIGSKDNNPVFSTRSLLVRKISTGEVVAIGDEATERILQTGEELITPIENGVMVDYSGAVSIIQHTLSQVLPWWHIFKPQVVVSESLELSTAISQAVGEAVQTAGGGRVYMTSVPTLSALGAGVDPTKPVGSFLLDIGGGTTEAAVITRGSIAVGKSIPVGGIDFKSNIINYVEQRYDVELSYSTAEEIIKAVGTALERDSNKSHTFYANDPDTNETTPLKISANEVAEAISDTLDDITEVVHSVIKQTPTALLSDIATNGIIITGGVGNLDHIDTYIKRELSIPVQVIDRPEQAVVRGGQKALEFISVYEQSVPQVKE